MKKILTILAIALAAGASQAVVIFQDDFSSSTSTNSSLFGARIGDTTIETNYNKWYSGIDYITNGALQIKGAASASNNATAPKAGVIVLDGSSISAGTLTLSWSYTNWNNTHIDVQIWDVQRGGGTTNYYTVKYSDSGFTANQIILNGNATKTLLGAFSFTNTSGAGAAGSTNLTVTYDGTGDIALMFGAAPNTAYYVPITKFDNVSLDFVATPSDLLDNFEGYILDDLPAPWVISGFAYAQEVVAEEVSPGVTNQFWRSYGGSATNGGAARDLITPINTNELKTVSFKVRPRTDFARWSEFGVSGLAAASVGTNDPAAFVRIQSLNLSVDTNGLEAAGYKTVAGISTGTWTTVELDINNSNDTYDVIVNGASVAVDIPFKVAVPGEILSFKSAHQKDIWAGDARECDDISVTTTPNRLPFFRTDTENMPVALAGDGYSETLDPVDPNNEDTLTVTKTAVLNTQGGSDWLTVNPNGTLSGTPASNNAGTNSWTVGVTDGSGGTNYVTLKILVAASLWNASTNVLAAATQNVAYVAASLTNIVTDTTPLTFTNLSGGWLTVAANGDLGGTPGPYDGGKTNEFTVRASDGSLSSDAVLKIWVANVNDAPVWGANPFDKGYVAVAQSLSDTLADRTFDYDGNSLTYTKTSGPAWLNIATNGALSGTPAVGNKGVNSWTVTVSDGTLSATSTFSVVVISGTLVYEQNFNTGTTLYGGFKGPNEDGSRWTMTVDLEATPTAWGHTWSTNSSSDNLFDGNQPTDVAAGISGALELSQNASGADSEGAGVAIASNVFGGVAGWYEATVSHVTNNAFNAVSRLGLEVWKARQGVPSTNNDYYLSFVGYSVGSGNPTGGLKIDKPAGSDAAFAELASADLGTTLGSRNVTFYYDGNGDVCLLFGCSADGRGRSAIDNVRVFRVAAAVDSYSTWTNTFGAGSLREYGLDVNNSGIVEADERPVLNTRTMTYVYQKRLYPPTVTYTLRTSTNLVNGTWSNLYSTVTGTGTALPGDAWVAVTNSVTSTNRLFLKLDVTE